MQKGGTITYRYNSFGKLREITDQEGNREFFYYHEEGQRQLHIDRNGNVERTRCNMDQALVYRRGEDKKGNHGVVSRYVYYPDGSLKESIGGGMTYGYQYTKGGRLKKKLENGVPVFAYQYDKNGNIKSICHGEVL